MGFVNSSTDISQNGQKSQKCGLSYPFVFFLGCAVSLLSPSRGVLLIFSLEYLASVVQQCNQTAHAIEQLHSCLKEGGKLQVEAKINFCPAFSLSDLVDFGLSDMRNFLSCPTLSISFLLFQRFPTHRNLFISHHPPGQVSETSEP